MNRSGIIYQAPSFLKRALYHLLRAVGVGFIGFAMIGIIFSFYPILKEEVSFKLRKPVKIDFGDLITSPSAQELNLDPFFSIYIPKIEARASVVPNVNAGRYYEYTKALEEGVAHAAGTNFPGQGKLIYLFSHSTDSALNFARYNAIFYLVRKLEKGDRIIIYFMNKEYKYIVQNKAITEADDTSWFEDRGKGEVLVLQTCDPPGTSINRLVVEAIPVEY